jgi:hypothetical protein
VPTTDLTPLFIILGGFYTFAGIVSARAALMDALMDAAIAELSGKKHPKLELERNAVLLAMVCGVGASGLLLMIGSNIALPAFLASCAMQVGYYFVLSPRRYEVEEPVSPEGRQRSLNALILYAIVTCFVAWAAWTGELRPIQAQHPLLLSIVGLTWIGGTAWAFRWLFTMRKARKGTALGDGYVRTPSHDEAYTEARYLEVQAALKLWAQTAQLYVRPAIRFSPLFDAATDETVSWDELEVLELPKEVREDLINYGSYCAYAISADDPLQLRLVNGVTMDELTEQGQLMFARLQAVLGDKIEFRPDLRPQLPVAHPLRVDIGLFEGRTCAFEGWPPGAEADDVLPYDLAISANLSHDFGGWSLDYREYDYRKDLPPPDTASPDDLRTMIETGRALAVRLADELAQTERGHIPVYYHTPDGRSELIGA